MWIKIKENYQQIFDMYLVEKGLFFHSYGRKMADIFACLAAIQKLDR